MARKQQKLLGFGPRWQTADPTESLTREHEVQQALQQLEEAYRRQRQVQDRGSAECAADFLEARRRAVLKRRRGQTVESFGKREDGEWMLEPEEMLYLAERGTLAVFEEAGGSKKRLSMPELYSKVLARPVQLDPDSYMVYSHLRRSGYTVTRPTEACTPQRLWRVAAASADCPAEVLVVRPDEPVLPCLLKQLGATSWEGQGDALQSQLAKGLGVAVSSTAQGSPAFLELLAPRCPGEEAADAGGAGGVGAVSSQSEDGSEEDPETVRAACGEPLGLGPAGAEEALEPRQRYAAILQRVSAIAAPSEGQRQEGSKSKSAKKSQDAQDAWLL